MKNVAYLAENFGSLPSGSLSLESAMHLCGHNVGNFAFWNAARKLFDAEIRLFGFGSKIEALSRDNVDFVVIPAANFLNATANLDWLARLIRELDKPVVVVGLGAQSEREEAIPELKPGTVDFLREAAARTPYLAVRGPFSKRVCEAYGVTNVRVLGCPSLFTNPDRQLGAAIEARWSRPIDKLAIHASSIKAHVRHAERMLFGLLASHPGSSYIIQRPIELMKVARGEALSEAESTYVDKVHAFLAPDQSRAGFDRSIRMAGVVPSSIDSWLFMLEGHSHSVGTRIHGAMLSLSAKLPTLCITHDTRTRELCEVLKVPSIECTKVSGFSSVADMFAARSFSGEAFEDNRTALGKQYKALMNEVGLGASKYLANNF
jgi:hypothetical protein